MITPDDDEVGTLAVMSTTAATFCATLVDEWVRAGVTVSFAAPGSRSTPLALALQADPRMQLHVFHDERAAGFAALGHATATGTPTVVTCTSGTAAAHFHAAVIEADLSAVPLIVCTTDRPPELWDVGAPQTVDQNRLFGHAVRSYVQPGVPDEAMAGAWRSIGSRLVAEALGVDGTPGPVHANLSFRDPLVGVPGELPPGRPAGAPWHRDLRAGTATGARTADGVGGELWNRIRGLRGVIVAGNGTSDPASVLALGRRLGWPVLADHRSGCRAEGQAVAHADCLLRSTKFAADTRPDVVLRFGQPLASKVLSQWLAGLDAELISAPGRWPWLDPERVADLLVTEPGLARALLNEVPPDYQRSADADRWARADAVAEDVIADWLAARDEVTEIEVARATVERIPTGGALLVASSMPVRDVEWFGPNRRDIKVHANRGANGIDGLIATATGIALTGTPTTLLIGDVAFLHDSSALVALADRSVDLTIIVVDNDGGGIFSFLPQAELVEHDRYEQLFGTPHGTDLAALCGAHGIPAGTWPDVPTDGPVRVSIATTERTRNREVHDELNRHIVAAVEEAGRAAGD